MEEEGRRGVGKEERMREGWRVFWNRGKDRFFCGIQVE